MRRCSRRPDAYMYVRSTLASWSSMAAISAPRGRPSAWKRRALPCRRTSALGSVAVDYGFWGASPARMMTLETRFPPTAPLLPRRCRLGPGCLLRGQPATRATHRRLAHRPRRRPGCPVHPVAEVEPYSAGITYSDLELEMDSVDDPAKGLGHGQLETVLPGSQRQSP